MRPDVQQAGWIMKHFSRFILLTSVSVLVACASSLPKPEEYGFHRVAIKGQEYFCAPTQWVIPPVSGAPTVTSPAGIPSGLFAGAYPKTGEVCLTQAQWPDWLTLRNRLNRQWPITPSEAQALADR
jgi:hypothetical protein